MLSLIPQKDACIALVSRPGEAAPLESATGLRSRSRRSRTALNKNTGIQYIKNRQKNFFTSGIKMTTHYLNALFRPGIVTFSTSCDNLRRGFPSISTSLKTQPANFRNGLVTQRFSVRVPVQFWADI
jgi:hypothetical protein